MDIDLDQLARSVQAAFQQECEELLDQLESDLLSLEANPGDAETVNAAFRAAHSIKGGAGACGYTAIVNLTHVAEALLGEFREGRKSPSRESVALLLKSVDYLRDMLAAVASEDVEFDAEAVVELQRELETELGTSSEEAPAVEEGTAGAKVFEIRFAPLPGFLERGNDALRLIRELSGLGELETTVTFDELPSLEDLDPVRLHLKWAMVLSTEADEADIREVFDWVDDDCELEVTLRSAAPQESKEVEKPAPVEAPKSKGGTPRAAPGPRSMIRVHTDKIDALINMVGELVITQSILGELDEDYDDQLTIAQIDRIREGLRQLARNTRELQEGVMRVRMLPISDLFQRVPRLVHDLSRKLGKEVRLEVHGEQTELDRTLLERLSEPLVHLVRNSLDHGVETPEQREAAGKPIEGCVTLRAAHQSGNVVIEISDDGKGLDTERIRSKAVKQGLIEPNAARTVDEIHQLVFRPGFSTATEVSDVSGRGVGMDVVSRNIKSLGGHVMIRSTAGQGSTTMIKLPLTLAILDAQLVRVGSETFVIPILSIVESLQAQKNR
ncbi:MAG: chemotaxis protein CheA, partial [Myxococcota bacterium]